MGFRRKKRFREPSTIEDLADVSKLKELCNGFLNKRKLKGTKYRIFASNRPCITSVNFSLIVLDRDSDAFLAEDMSALLDKRL